MHFKYKAIAFVFDTFMSGLSLHLYKQPPLRKMKVKHQVVQLQSRIKMFTYIVCFEVYIRICSTETNIISDRFDLLVHFDDRVCDDVTNSLGIED